MKAICICSGLFPSALEPVKKISGRRSAKGEGAIVTAKLNTRDTGGGLIRGACDCHKDVSVYVDLKYDART